MNLNALYSEMDSSWEDALIRGLSKAPAADEFKESEHPRGQPENAGEFSSSGSAGKPASRTAALVEAPADQESWPEHIKAIRIPPAWVNVRISSDPNAELLVTGRDSKGRGQAIYSAKFNAAQAAAKFARIQELDKKFGSIEAQNRKNQKSDDAATREHADCMALIMKMGVRPGSEDDTGAEVHAYGASTLEGRHVVAEGGKLYLRFIGKKGVSLDLQVEDPGIAALLRKRASSAGPDGKLFSGVSEGSLLKYSHGFDGGGFKTKDFRTLLATRTAMDAVAKAAAPADEKGYKKAVREIAKFVSAKLGNTPLVALQSYINPVVFAGWRGVSGMAMAHDAEEETAMLPEVRFGNDPLPDWRKVAGDLRDDDEPLAKTPEDVVAMLGFDPLDDEIAKDAKLLGYDRSPPWI